MTNRRCIDPAIGDDLLDAVRPAASQGGARSPARTSAMSREQLRHLETCAGCRVSVERARRLVTTHQALAPSESEVAAVRRRLAARTDRHRHRTRSWRLLPRAITVGLVLAAVASAAAQIAARRRAPAQDDSDEIAPTAKTTRHRGRAWQRTTARAATDLALAADWRAAPGDSASVEPGIDPASHPQIDPQSGAPASEPRAVLRATPSAPAAPARLEGTGASALAPHVHRAARHLGAAAFDHAAAAAQAETVASGTSGSWEVAAAALRAGDAARAESALDVLAASADRRTGDAARLARAQLWLSHDEQGVTARARADLEDLAATGATSMIRQRAREALGGAR